MERNGKRGHNGASAASFDEITRVLSGLDDKLSVSSFLDALLTPSERARIALRWRLVCLLAAGLPQRVIADELGISLCKITRGSRELKQKPDFRKLVARVSRSGKRKF